MNTIKPFAIHKGTLKINVSDLHTFLGWHGIKFSSLADIHVKPVGVIVQCEVEHPISDAKSDELLTALSDLIDESQEDETVLYPIVSGAYSPNENQLIAVPHGEQSYEHAHVFENVPQHFSAGGEVPSGEIDYVLYNGNKVFLFGEVDYDPSRTEVMYLINERIAAAIALHVEKINKNLFDKGYAYNLVVNEIRERTKQFETPFVVTEQELDEVIQKIIE